MNERFSSRWGLLAASVGMAIGTGNIWRFPRVVAANGGGAFFIPWLLFLLAWSVPLLVAEFHLGRASRRGPLGAFLDAVSPQAGVLGGFVVVTSLGIFAYYSVVTGWCLGYLAASLLSWPALSGDGQQFWSQTMSGSLTAILGQGVALVAAALVIRLGVVGGIERVNKVLIPSLFGLLVLLAGYALSQPGALPGVRFLFVPEWGLLREASIWLEAASQSAWSTGAGWGLLIVYASYARDIDDPVSNPLITGVGNNAASILAALAVLPTTFARLPRGEALRVLAAGNQGLTFITLPALFAQMAGGRAVAVVFFVALSFAAFSSLLSMMELGVRTLGDLGLPRSRASWITAGFGLAAGAPSALSMAVFDNQDWVWGIGLLLTGCFIAIGIMIRGVPRFLDETVPAGRWLVRGWLGLSLGLLVPLTFVLLLGWWFLRAVTVYDPNGWWHPLRRFSVSTCLLQWAVGIVLAAWMARFARRLLRSPATGDTSDHASSRSSGGARRSSSDVDPR